MLSLALICITKLIKVIFNILVSFLMHACLGVSNPQPIDPLESKMSSPSAISMMVGSCFQNSITISRVVVSHLTHPKLQVLRSSFMACRHSLLDLHRMLLSFKLLRPFKFQSI